MDADDGNTEDKRVEQTTPHTLRAVFTSTEPMSKQDYRRRLRAIVAGADPSQTGATDQNDEFKITLPYLLLAILGTPRYLAGAITVLMFIAGALRFLLYCAYRVALFTVGVMAVQIQAESLTTAHHVSSDALAEEMQKLITNNQVVMLAKDILANDDQLVLLFIGSALLAYLILLGTLMRGWAETQVQPCDDGCQYCRRKWISRLLFVLNTAVIVYAGMYFATEVKTAVDEYRPLMVIVAVILMGWMGYAGYTVCWVMWPRHDKAKEYRRGCRIGIAVWSICLAAASVVIVMLCGWSLPLPLKPLPLSGPGCVLAICLLVWWMSAHSYLRGTAANVAASESSVGKKLAAYEWFNQDLCKR